MLEDRIEQTVIVADNDTMVRGLIRSILEQPGRAMLLAGDGDEAIAHAAQVQAALVLLDLRMPRVDGITACRRIRELPNYREIPIAILTLFDGDRVRREARRAGATAFFAKPFTTDGLRRGLEPLIAAGQAAAARVAPPEMSNLLF
ncbi:MAG: hypothetical protein BGO51_16365 [Rhodospirillales bacterium 69-11]|nr:response regulator [Rhodospirillales bacterium]OJW28899.1 MAG: hypothetical protein BGO51_16365 [Rhodospirillales bacterium 69-11]